MLGSPIRATDERVLPFTAEQIWAVLVDVRNYPNWYPGSVKVAVLKANAELVGTEFEIRPRGGRAFRCCAESADALRAVHMKYPGDFIVGKGAWRLAPVNGGTRVIYEIDVVATGWVAGLLGHVLPLAKLHSRAMQEILVNLERETARRVAT